MRQTIILILGMIILLDCSSPKTQEDIDWSQITTQLKARELKADSTLFTGISVRTMHKDIIIGMQLASKLFKVCRITRDSISSIGEFLALGNGPHEMHIPYLYWDIPNKKLTIHEHANGKNKIISIPAEPLSNLFDVNTWEVSQFSCLRRNHPPVDPVTSIYLKEGKFIACPIYNSEKMFALLDKNCDSIQLLDFDYPKDGCQVDDPLRRKPIAYSGKIMKHPTKKQFVYTPYRNRYMLIFEYREGQIKEIAAPYKMYPRYTMAKDGRNIRFMPDTYLGMNLYTTSKYIYALMNDMTNEDWNNDKLTDGFDATYSNEIYVFDWDGKPVRKYVTDHRTRNFWVDENDRAIYATTEDMENPDRGTIFLRYSL